MADSKRYMDWYAKASTELESAEILYKNSGSYAIVAFLCQQTIEKAYKGYILKHQELLVTGHGLVSLCKRMGEINAQFLNFIKDCAYVNQFYLESRYPADLPFDISEADARECLRIAKEIIRFVME